MTKKLTKVDMLTEMNKLTEAGKVKRLRDKSLKDRVAYTLKKATEKVASVDAATVREVYHELLTALTPKQPQKAVASAKPLPKKAGSSKPASKPAPAAKKPAPKAAPAKAAPSNEPVFPDTIENEELGTLTRAGKEQFTTAEEIRAAIENGTEFFAAVWWPKAIIKQSYKADLDVPAPASFPDDLDLLHPLMVLESLPRAIFMSVYTEALVKIDEKDMNVNKNGYRVSVGAEYDFYVKGAAKKTQSKPAAAKPSAKAPAKPTAAKAAPSKAPAKKALPKKK